MPAPEEPASGPRISKRGALIAGAGLAAAGLLGGRAQIAHGIASVPLPPMGPGAAAYLRLPPGVYRASTLSIAVGDIALVADIPGTVEIQIEDGAYLLDLTGRINRLTLDGIIFRGGKGAVRLNRTEQNVACLVEITRCSFFGYTECALGNNSSDHPFLRIRDCMFECGESAHAIGVAWGGYVDGGSIESCAFLRNTYHLKIGPRLSGSFHVRANDFYLSTPFAREADVWLVPNGDPKSFGVNSGWGMVFDENKFGNENQTMGKPRVLVADEDAASGHDRLTRFHAARWSEASYLSGVTFTNHRISGRGDPQAPFLLSYISELAYLTWFNNKLDGSQYDYAIAFTNDRTETAYNDAWHVMLSAGDGRAFPKYGFTNASVENIHDPDGLLPSYYAHPPEQRVSPPARLAAMGSARLTSIDDPQRGAPSLNVTAASPDAGVYQPLDPGLAGAKCWLHLALRQAAAAPSERLIVTVEIVSPASHTILLQRRYPLDARIADITIPFTLPARNTGRWQLRVRPTQGAGEFVVEAAVISSGPRPPTMNHIETLGSGAWNGAHLVLGEFHIWVSAAGKLRMAHGAPGSDDAGSAVGA